MEQRRIRIYQKQTSDHIKVLSITNFIEFTNEFLINEKIQEKIYNDIALVLYTLQGPPSENFVHSQYIPILAPKASLRSWRVIT